MRQAYAHHAVLTQVAGDAAPDGAITAALSGYGEHHTTATRENDLVRLRILFVTEPHRVDEARSTIDAALAAGDWQLEDAGCARIDPAEHEHARRLLKSR